MAATELYKAIAQPSEHSFLNRFDVDEEALRRVRHGRPGEAAVAAGGELPPEARHDVVHGHQRVHPGELVPGADARAAAFSNRAGSNLPGSGKMAGSHYVMLAAWITFQPLGMR